MNSNTLLKSTVSFIFKHYRLLIAVFILISAFLISRLPYFMYFPIVGYHPDTPDYFMLVEAIHNGLLPKFGLLPPLYPVFLSLTGSITNSPLTIVIIQNLISFFVTLFFIFCVYRIFEKLAIGASIAFFVFYMSSSSIAFDTMLTTESLYTSSLILIAAFSLLCLHSKRKSVWLLFSLILTFPFLIRPSGFIIFILIGVFFLFMFFNKYALKFYVYLLLPFFGVIVIGIIYNLITLSQPIPDRISNFIPFSDKKDDYQMYFDNFQGKQTPFSRERWNEVNDSIYGFISETSKKQDESGEFKLYHSKFLKFLIFLNAISYDSRPFYSEELHRRYYDFYNNDFIKNCNWNQFNVAFLSEDIKMLMFKNYYIALPQIDFFQKADIKNQNSSINKSITYNIYNFYYNYLFKYIFRTKLFILIVGLAFILSLIKLWHSKLKDALAFYLFFLLLILFVTSGFYSLTGFNTGSWRYVYPTEFIYYLTTAFLPYLINFKLLTKLKSKIKITNKSQY